MKQKIKLITGFLITLILTFLLISYFGVLLDPAWSGDGIDAINAFHSLNNDSLDIIVYGSSHAWKGCDTGVMRDKYGLAAYNYGCNWQSISTTQLFLLDSLRTQSPKIALIETLNIDSVLSDVDMDGQIYYTRAISNFDGKRAYLKQCFAGDLERYATYYFPLIMFHDNWKNISYENFLHQGKQRYVDSAGFCPGWNIYPCDIPDSSGSIQNDLNAESIKVLDNIVQTCQEHNVTVIFYTCPFSGKYYYSDAMRKYAESNNCIYLDLFDYKAELGLDGEKDLQDEGHLNIYGAAKVGDFLGKYLIENYSLPSH